MAMLTPLLDKPVMQAMNMLKQTVLILEVKQSLKKREPTTWPVVKKFGT